MGSQLLDEGLPFEQPHFQASCRYPEPDFFPWPPQHVSWSYFSRETPLPLVSLPLPFESGQLCGPLSAPDHHPNNNFSLPGFPFMSRRGCFTNVKFNPSPVHDGLSRPFAFSIFFFLFRLGLFISFFRGSLLYIPVNLSFLIL